MHEPVDGSELTAQVGDKIVVAYLVYDNDQSPEDLLGDCMGKLYNFRRDSDTVGDGLNALGNTSYGEPDLDRVWSNHSDEVTRRYLAKIRKDYSFRDVKERLNDGTIISWRGVLKMLADEIDCVSNWDRVEFEDEMEDTLTQMWAEPEFFPGDQDAQVLDCYDHSGQHWSLSGQGMQCRWDTSNRAGVWVPDDCLRKELDETAQQAVYALVGGTSWVRGTGKSYQLLEVKWSDDTHNEQVSVKFSDDPSELHALAREIVVGKPKPTVKQLRWGRAEQARIYCKQFLSIYNDIISGRVYGCVVETFDLEGERLEDDACWGFTGDYAEECLKSDYFEPACATVKVGDCV